MLWFYCSKENYGYVEHSEPTPITPVLTGKDVFDLFSRYSDLSQVYICRFWRSSEVIIISKFDLIHWFIPNLKEGLQNKLEQLGIFHVYLLLDLHFIFSRSSRIRHIIVTFGYIIIYKNQNDLGGYIDMSYSWVHL